VGPFLHGCQATGPKEALHGAHSGKICYRINNFLLISTHSHGFAWWRGEDPVDIIKLRAKLTNTWGGKNVRKATKNR